MTRRSVAASRRSHRRARPSHAASANAGRTAEDELPTLDVTHWTDKTELFMEYPPLVAGQTALFAVHLTRSRTSSR